MSPTFVLWLSVKAKTHHATILTLQNEIVGLRDENEGLQGKRDRLEMKLRNANRKVRGQKFGTFSDTFIRRIPCYAAD